MKDEFVLLDNLICSYNDVCFGDAEEEIKEKESSLGIIFPRELKEYYKSYGKCKYITQNCNNQYEPILVRDIFVPGKDFFTDDKDYIVFYQCQESVIYCGIKFSDLQKEDPPVYQCVWDEPNWCLENNSLRNFLVCKALTQIALERMPYWIFFYESMWKLSDYLKLWEVDEEKSEVKETTRIPGYRIFVKEDVLIIFFLAEGNENNDSINAVKVASFNKSSAMKMLSEKIQNSEAPEFTTNLF